MMETPWGLNPPQTQKQYVGQQFEQLKIESIHYFYLNINNAFELYIIFQTPLAPLKKRILKIRYWYTTT